MNQQVFFTKTSFDDIAAKLTAKRANKTARTKMLIMLIAQKCTGHAEQEYQQTMQDYKVLHRRFNNKKTTNMRMEKLACVGFTLLVEFSNVIGW